MVFGYIDAGTGGLIVQAIVAGVAGIATFVKFRWGWIKSRFRGDDNPEERPS